MGYRDLVYRLYERRLESSLVGKAVPRHVSVITDGNRRWARSAGHTDVSKGHRKGADKIFELLGWCKQTGVEVVTLWLLSTDNLSRPPILKVPAFYLREKCQGTHIVRPIRRRFFAIGRTSGGLRGVVPRGLRAGG